MSGFPNRRNLQNQNDYPENVNEANTSGTPSIPSVNTSSSAASLHSYLSSQELLAATFPSQMANPGFLQLHSNAHAHAQSQAQAALGGPRASSGMPLWQDQFDAARTSSLFARMAQLDAQIQHHHHHQQAAEIARLQLHQQQQQQQQQAAVAVAIAQQQEELELNALLRQKRQIDDMLLQSALSARRFSMDRGGVLQKRLGRGGGVPSFPLSMSATASSLIASGSPNTSNRPIMGDSDLTGKIRALEGGRRGMGMMSSWADQSRPLASSQNSRLGAMAPAAGMMPGTAPSSMMAPTRETAYDDATNEDDDEIYFNDGGADEVDRDFKRSQENFPLKLYRIIHEVGKSGRGDVISFFPHGRAFAVHKPKEFIDEIMPEYFATGRMNTFLKQLNLYGFRRITEGRDKGGYFHPKFILGKRSLCKGIKRKKTDSKPAAVKTPPGSPEAKEADGLSSPVSTEKYATSLSEQMRKQRKERGKKETRSPHAKAQAKSKVKSKNPGDSEGTLR